jgi:hypothetical protein
MSVRTYSIHDLKNIYLKLFLSNGELSNKDSCIEILQKNQNSEVLDPSFKEKIKKLLSQYNIS